MFTRELESSALPTALQEPGGPFLTPAPRDTVHLFSLCQKYEKRIISLEFLFAFLSKDQPLGVDPACLLFFSPP